MNNISTSSQETLSLNNVTMKETENKDDKRWSFDAVRMVSESGQMFNIVGELVFKEGRKAKEDAENIYSFSEDDIIKIRKGLDPKLDVKDGYYFDVSKDDKKKKVLLQTRFVLEAKEANEDEAKRILKNEKAKEAFVKMITTVAAAVAGVGMGMISGVNPLIMAGVVALAKEGVSKVVGLGLQRIAGEMRKKEKKRKEIIKEGSDKNVNDIKGKNKKVRR